MGRVPRWLRWTLAGFAALVVFVVLVAPALVEPIVRRQLQAMISKHFTATLEIGGLSYWPPFTVVVKEARLVGKTPDGSPVTLLDVKRLEMTLAKFPSRHGPLVIRDLTIIEPRIHVIKLPGGAIESPRTAVRKRPEPDNPANIPPEKKTSDYFRLEHFAIRNLSVQVEDLTRPAEPPLVWRELNAESNLTRRGPADYDFRVSASNKPSADLDVDGAVNVDTGLLTVKALNLDAKADGEHTPSQLPATAQRVCRDYGITGELHVRASATIPLKDAAAADYKGSLVLKHGAATVPQWRAALARLDLSLEVSGRGPRSEMRLVALDAGAGDTTLTLDEGATLDVDTSARRWSLAKLQGRLALGTECCCLPEQSRSAFQNYHPRGRVRFTAAGGGPLPGPGVPRGAHYIDALDPSTEMLAYADADGKVSLRPPTFPEPITDIAGGPVKLVGGVVSFNTLSGRYGRDELLLNSARLPLSGVFRKVFRYEEIRGTVRFNPPSLDYPPALKKTIAALHPGGEYVVGGWVQVDKSGPAPATDYDLLVSSDNGTMSVTERKIYLQHVQGDARIVPGRVRVRGVRCAVAGGTVLVDSGSVETRPPFAYETALACEGIDLRAVGKIYKVNDPHGRLSGKGQGTMHLTGAGQSSAGSSPAQTLRGNGSFQIYDGDFWDIPVIDDLVSSTRTHFDEAGRVGQGAGVFTIDDQAVHLSQVAVGSPVLGLQGSGDVRFDKKIDLRVVAAPLSDWKAKLNQTGIPVIGDIAGGIQQLLNGATGTLLYEFRITGDASKPNIQTVPAPILTDTAANLFSYMMNPGGGGNLLDVLQGKIPTTNKAR